MRSLLTIAAASLLSALLVPQPVFGEGDNPTIEPAGSKVNVLTFDTFHRFLSSHDSDLILMEFYAPWCGHCQQLAPAYREAAAELAQADLPRRVVLAKYDDGDEYNRRLRAGAPDVYNFTSYPSLFVFDGGEHERYGGGREADDIIFHMTALANGLDPYEEELKTKPGLYKDNPEYKDVIRDLMEEEEMGPVIAHSPNNALRVVEFYSDRCPFCKSLAKEYVAAAQTLKSKFGGKVEFHAVNSRVYYDVAEEWGITGYPWVCFFYNGEKVEDMAGLGGADSIVNWVSNMVGTHWKEGSAPAKPAVPAPVESSSDAPEKADGTTSDDGGAAWRAELGRHTWFLLHTLAAKYPDNPSASEKSAMLSMIGGLGTLYPCKLCRSHLQEKLSATVRAPDVSSREALSVWMCELHNSVNKDLGKEQHDCTPFKLDLQYLKDCGECKEEKKGTAKPSGYVSGTWNGDAWVRDPGYYSSVVRSEADAWEAGELMDLFDLSVQLGVTTEAGVDRMKKKIKEGKQTQGHYMNFLAGEVEEIISKI